MTTTLSGGCLCQAIRYRITMNSPDLPGTYCHCSMCRKATGGGYAAFVSVPRDALVWTQGTVKQFRSSPVATRGFCENCGSPLFYDADAEDHLALTVGSLDDASGFKADHHYGVESRLPWADCGPDLPGHATTEQFAGQPSGFAAECG